MDGAGDDGRLIIAIWWTTKHTRKAMGGRYAMLGRTSEGQSFRAPGWDSATRFTMVSRGGIAENGSQISHWF